MDSSTREQEEVLEECVRQLRVRPDADENYEFMMEALDDKYGPKVYGWLCRLLPQDALQNLLQHPLASLKHNPQDSSSAWRILAHLSTGRADPHQFIRALSLLPKAHIYSSLNGQMGLTWVPLKRLGAGNLIVALAVVMAAKGDLDEFSHCLLRQFPYLAQARDYSYLVSSFRTLNK